MKFATVALLGALVSFTEMVEGQRTRNFEVVRANCSIGLQVDKGPNGLLDLNQVVFSRELAS